MGLGGFVKRVGKIRVGLTAGTPRFELPDKVIRKAFALGEKLAGN